MAAIMQQLQAWVSASGILADKMAVIMIIALFGLMVVGLVLGQELAFVLGGAGVIIGWLAWGGPGVTIAMTKIYDQMQSYSMVAIPMFVLMANFLTHSKVADGLFESIRYLLGPLKGGLGLAVILVSTVFAATTGIVGASVDQPLVGTKIAYICGSLCLKGTRCGCFCLHLIQYFLKLCVHEMPPVLKMDSINLSALHDRENTE